MGYLLTPIILLTLLALIFGTFFIVKQQSAAVVERFGKFLSVRHSGLQIKIPLVDNVAGRLSLRIQQLDVVVETKTKDDVFVKIKVSVQYKVIKNKVYDAFYKLDFPQDLKTHASFDRTRMLLDDCQTDAVAPMHLLSFWVCPARDETPSVRKRENES